MAGEDRTLTELVRILAKTGEQVFSEVGTVKEINEEERTCTVVPSNGNAEILDVNLQANINLKNGIVMFPVIDSEVMVTFLSEENAYISLYSDIDRIVINNGENGGLINIVDLVDKLNTVEDDLNNLKNIFALWVPVSQDGGAALKAALANYLTDFILPTTKLDLEDPNVTH